MTGDAQAEAERIVHDLTASAFNGGRCHALGDMEGRQRWRVEEQGECDRLVAALAATITTVDHYLNGSAYMEQVLDEQAEALSVLRGET